MDTKRMRYVECPCGVLLEGANDEVLVEAVQRHLAQEHQHLSYSREQILLFAR